MTDFEVCPIGTTARLAELEVEFHSLVKAASRVNDVAIWNTLARQYMGFDELRAVLEDIGE